MDSYHKAAAWVGTIGVLILGLVMLISGSATQPNSGSATSNTGTEQITPWGFGGGIQIGPSSGAPVLKLVAAGTCNASTTGVATLAATTTALASCALGGNYNLNATDIVDITGAAGSGANGGTSFGTILPFGGFVSTAGKAPTLSWYYENLSGGATTSYTQATTSVGFQIFRIQ